MNKEDNKSGGGVVVIMDNLLEHPVCPHGPTLLFERRSQTPTRFYACSACRDRRDCPFYITLQDWQKNKCKTRFRNLPPLGSYKYSGKLIKQIKSIELSQRRYCHTCSTLYVLDGGEDTPHSGHDVSRDVTDECLWNPSRLLKPLLDAKKEAQYLFSTSCVDVIINILERNKFKNVVCLGTPRIHERIQQNASASMKSLLLDIDGRYQIFWPPNKFLHYNIFNNHFFNGQKDEETFQDFFKSDGKETCLIMDPPFGGRIEPLACTLRTISSISMASNNSKEDKLLPIILVMPYFMEPQVNNYIEELKMTDYQIAYDNHTKFQANQKKSTVRLFTNIPLSKILLPESEGYKFCKSCSQWIGSWNKHCAQCKSCTSKNGTMYVHCDVCNKCVKPTWVHCNKCKRCSPLDHFCGTLPTNQICFNCQKSGHKKAKCPLLETNKRKSSEPDTTHQIKKIKSNKSQTGKHEKKRNK